MLPLIKAMLINFAEAFPRPISYADLVAAVRAKLDGKIVLSDNDLQAMGDHLIRFVIDNMVQLHIEEPTVSAARAAKARAFAPARLAPQRGAQQVTNLRHEAVALNQIEAKVMALLDGSSSKEDLTQALVERAAKHEFTFTKDNVALTDEQQIRPIVSQLVGDCLHKFEKLALLA